MVKKGFSVLRNLSWRAGMLPALLLVLWAIQAHAQLTPAKVEALVEALRLSAPQTGRSDDGLYSDWKIKPDNITRWSKRCLGQELTPAQFGADPVVARRVLACVMGKVLTEQYAASGNNEIVAVQRAAAWWMTGNPDLYNSGSTGRYTLRVLEAYLQFF